MPHIGSRLSKAHKGTWSGRFWLGLLIPNQDEDDETEMFWNILDFETTEVRKDEVDIQ